MTTSGGTIPQQQVAAPLASICPCCGYDLEVERPATFGPLSFAPREGVSAHGERLWVSPQCHEVLGALMREPGRVISRPALEDRLGCSDQSNILDVYLCRIRAEFRRIGLANPLVTIRRCGVMFDPSRLAPASARLVPIPQHNGEA